MILPMGMDKSLKKDAYYQEVARYYNEDASDFEQRYTENPVLHRIRNAFRAITDELPFRNALEIGCGPGFDAAYFGLRYPDRSVFAIDVAPGMINLAKRKIDETNLTNVRLAAGSVEDVPSLFPDQKFDLVYVYFGGLNTVYDLQKAAEQIRLVCTDDANLVLTVVNRYYLTEIPLWVLKGRFDKAFERVRNKWRGYSDHRKIPSTPYSAKDMTNAFSEYFEITSHRGYSILYPAWYRAHLLNKLGKVANWLWKADDYLAKTPLKNIGEYSLYVLKAK